MPINISISGVDLLAKLNVPELYMSALHDAGIGIVIGLSVLKFHKEGVVLGAVTIDKNLVVEVVKGDGPLSGKVVQQALNMKKQLEKIIMDITSIESPSGLHNPFADKPDAVLVEAAGVVVAGALMDEVTEGLDAAPAVSPVTEGWGIYSQSKMQTGERVPMMGATKLYQPVFSTSDSSRYFLVAGHEHLRVAARYIKSKLSVRIEGDVQGIKQRLMDIGIGADAAKMAKNYASIHVESVDEFIAAKALGAILVGLDCGSLLPLPSIGVLMGKGS